MIHTKTLDKFLDRAALDVGAYGTHRTAHDLVEAEAIAGARCQLVNGELEAFTRFCYQKQGSWFVNLSGNTQIPTGTWVPWGSSGKGRLSRLERDTVRSWLNAQARQRGPKPLYFYNRSSRRWHVDTGRYQTLDEALGWVQSNRLDGGLWLSIQGRLLGYE
jgi:hypothetical protein